jgi:hypothetical protein
MTCVVAAPRDTHHEDRESAIRPPFRQVESEEDPGERAGAFFVACGVRPPVKRLSS